MKKVILLVYLVGIVFTFMYSFQFNKISGNGMGWGEDCYTDNMCTPAVMAREDAYNISSSAFSAITWPISLPILAVEYHDIHRVIHR